jgi:ATP-dependent RNA helicase DDX55/SPB4
LGSVARSFGLLRLPKMPELKHLKVNFEETKVDQEIQYKNTKRVIHEPKHVLKKKESVPWSQQKVAKQKKVERVVKKQKRRVAKEKAALILSN